MAIEGFKSGNLKRFHEKADASRLPKQYLARIADILKALDTSDPLGQLSASKYRLHRLKGSRKGEWSVRVSANLRVTFRLDRGDAYDIDLTDYH